MWALQESDDGYGAGGAPVAGEALLAGIGPPLHIIEFSNICKQCAKRKKLVNQWDGPESLDSKQRPLRYVTLRNISPGYY